MSRSKQESEQGIPVQLIIGGWDKAAGSIHEYLSSALPPKVIIDLSDVRFSGEEIVGIEGPIKRKLSRGYAIAFVAQGALVDALEKLRLPVSIALNREEAHRLLS